MDSKTKDSPLEINVKRPALSMDSLNENFAYSRRTRKGCCYATKNCLSKECSGERLKKGLKARVPFIDCIRNYSKSYIIGDTVAGITVGIMQIPLGMAYALLASCPAITGLYTSFFPVLIYFFLGTSRHISQGTFAIASLMLRKTVDRLATNGTVSNATFVGNVSSMSNISYLEGATYSQTDVATSVCLLAGVIQIILGILRFGALSVYLSDTLISGFTTGAAVLVFTSQFNAFFGISVPNFEWPFEIVYIYKYIFTHMPNTNIAALIIGLISIFVLAFTCEIINPKAMLKIKVPVPIELIAVIVGTGISYAMHFDKNYGVPIVGPIPGGLPAPEVPPFVSLFPQIALDAFIQAVVTYIISFSLARLFSKKYNYDINANQEFMAMGVANFASSFFQCFPMCVALSRSMVLDGVGGKTQIAGFLSCIIVLIVLLAIAPLFQSLPKCILAAIIVVGIRRMFLQFRDFVNAWKISKLEGATWMITFLAVCFISIDVGLGIGVAFSLFTVVLRSQFPYVTTLGHVKDSDLYLDIRKYNSTVEEKDIKIIHYGGPILFANSKLFRKKIYLVSDVNPKLVFKKMEKLNKKLGPKSEENKTIVIDMSDTKIILDGEGSSIFRNGETNQAFENDINLTEKRSDIDQMNHKNLSSADLLKMGVEPAGREFESNDINDTPSDNIIFRMKKGLVAIIIDGAAISCVDFAGVGAIIQVIEEYEKIGITVYFANLPGAVLEMFDSCDFRSRIQTQVIYPSIKDAILHLGQKETQPENKPTSLNSSTKL